MMAKKAVKTPKPAPIATFAPDVESGDSVKRGPGRPSNKVIAAEMELNGEMRQKVFRLTKAQERRLKEFCAHSDMTIQEVVLEGINLVFKAKGLPEF
jgi:hypothetical protein